MVVFYLIWWTYPNEDLIEVLATLMVAITGPATNKDAVSRFETAYNRARLAEQYTARGNTELAIGEWRKIFGGYFPAYG